MAGGKCLTLDSTECLQYTANGACIKCVGKKFPGGIGNSKCVYFSPFCLTYTNGVCTEAVSGFKAAGLSQEKIGDYEKYVEYGKQAGPTTGFSSAISNSAGISLITTGNFYYGSVDQAIVD